MHSEYRAGAGQGNIYKLNFHFIRRLSQSTVELRVFFFGNCFESNTFAVMYAMKLGWNAKNLTKIF